MVILQLDNPEYAIWFMGSNRKGHIVYHTHGVRRTLCGNNHGVQGMYGGEPKRIVRDAMCTRCFRVAVRMQIARAIDTEHETVVNTQPVGGDLPLEPASKHRFIRFGHEHLLHVGTYTDADVDAWLPERKRAKTLCGSGPGPQQLTWTRTEIGIDDYLCDTCKETALDIGLLATRRVVRTAYTLVGWETTGC
jgi:hypothetical protein